jgi:hypothetical protein
MDRSKAIDSSECIEGHTDQRMLGVGATGNRGGIVNRFGSPGFGLVAEPVTWPLAAKLPAVSDILPQAPVAGHRPPKRRRLRRALSVFLLLVLVGIAIAGWAVARQQSSVATRWQHDALAARVINREVGAELGTARRSIEDLDVAVQSARDQLRGTRDELSATQRQLHSTQGQLSRAQSNLSATQSQLSTVATQKEKEKDQNTVLQTVIASAGQVSARLESCVTDLTSVWSQLVDDIDNGTVDDDPTLDANVQTVVSECQAAGQANTELQAIITSISG